MLLRDLLWWWCWAWCWWPALARGTLSSAELQLLLQQNSRERFVGLWSLKAGQSLVLPAIVTDASSGVINWGDGTTDERCPLPPKACRHHYTQTGEFRVSTNMLLAGWTMADAEQATREGLVEIVTWGPLLLHPSKGKHFYNCTQLRALPAQPPLHTDKITSLDHSFALTPAFDSPGLGSWDTTNVVSLRGVLAMARVFNQDLSAWTTDRVQDAGGAFLQAAAFNQPLEAWHVHSLQDTTAMFAYAASFNQPLAAWSPTALLRAGSMFLSASAFSQDLSHWALPESVVCRYFAQDSALTNEQLPARLPASCR